MLQIVLTGPRRRSSISALVMRLCVGANAEGDAGCIERGGVEIQRPLPGMNEGVLESREAYLEKATIVGEDDGAAVQGTIRGLTVIELLLSGALSTQYALRLRNCRGRMVVAWVGAACAET